MVAAYAYDLRAAAKVYVQLTSFVAWELQKDERKGIEDC